MILRLSSTVARGIFVAVAVFLFVVLSYSSIRNARAVYYAGLNTREGFEHAARLEPGNAQNWYLLGRYWQYNLENPDNQKAIVAYRTALDFDPRFVDSLVELGTTYELEGNVPAARDAFLRAKNAYPLSAEIAWRYGNFLLRQGETDAAFTEIRHSVERDPKRGAEAFSRCLRVDPDIADVLDRIIPPSGAIYAEIVHDLIADNQIEGALKVWGRLVALHPKLSIFETYPLVNALLQAKRFDEASRVWDQAVEFAGVSQVRNPPNSAIWDGSFEADVPSVGFAWNFQSNHNGVQIARDSSEKHSGKRSLRIMFDGDSNINFLDVCQNAVVQPSTKYRFSAWIHTSGLSSDEGLRFRLANIGAGQATSARTPEVHGSTPWTRVDLDWTTQNDERVVQVCTARVPSEKSGADILGTAWIDDVQLIPDSSETPRP